MALTHHQALTTGRGRVLIAACFACGLSATTAATTPTIGPKSRLSYGLQAGSKEVTIVGCLQRGTGNAALGVDSPSGFLLMNASSSPYGGSAGAPSVEQSAPRGTELASPPNQARLGEPVPAPAGGAGVSPGLTYLLEGGSDLVAYAGNRVEVRGTLRRAAADKKRLVPQVARAGAPSMPQLLRISSIKPIAKDCSD